MTANKTFTAEVTVAGVPKTRTYDLAATAQPDSGWHTTKVSALHEAEDLLDALEAHGFMERELIVLGNASFAVRWR